MPSPEPKPSTARYCALLQERLALLNNADANRLPYPAFELVRLELELVLHAGTDQLVREWMERARNNVALVLPRRRTAFAELLADAEQCWRSMVHRTVPAIVDLVDAPQPWPNEDADMETQRGVGDER